MVLNSASALRVADPAGVDPDPNQILREKT